MTGLIGRVTTRQIVPGSARAQDPKDAIQHRASILPRPAPPILPTFGTKQRFEQRPLGVGDVHALDLRP
jgi:hypothetical protein